jgi:hypothetical protein
MTKRGLKPELNDCCQIKQSWGGGITFFLVFPVEPQLYNSAIFELTMQKVKTELDFCQHRNESCCYF